MEELFKYAESLGLSYEVSNSVKIVNGKKVSKHSIVLSDNKDKYSFNNVDDAIMFLNKYSNGQNDIDSIISKVKGMKYQYQLVPVLYEDKTCCLYILDNRNMLKKKIDFDCVYCLEDFVNNLDDNHNSCSGECLKQSDNEPYKEIDGLISLFEDKYKDSSFSWKLLRVKNTIFLKSKVYGIHIKATAENISELINLTRMISTDKLFQEYMKMCESLVEEQMDVLTVISNGKYSMEITNLEANDIMLKLEDMSLSEFANTIYSIIKQS